MKVLKDGIIFKFDDQVRNGRFIDQSKSGIFLGYHHDSSAKTPRTGYVVEVGPDVRDVKKGDHILIEPLMWTEGFRLDGEMFWKTAEPKVLAIVEE